MIKVKVDSFYYAKGTPYETRVINKLDFEIKKGELIGFIGRTGAGKTTLAQLIAGLINDKSAIIEFEGNIRFGYVFQYPEHQLFADTVFDDIAFGLKEANIDGDEIKRRVYDISKTLGIPKEYMNRSPFNLSGGEMRRVALAGILVLEPDVLILDEPTVGLDPKTRKGFISDLLRYKKKTGCTVVIITHDIDMMMILDRILVIKNGEKAFLDSPKRLFSNEALCEEFHIKLPSFIKLLNKLRLDIVLERNKALKLISEELKRKNAS